MVSMAVIIVSNFSAIFFALIVMKNDIAFMQEYLRFHAHISNKYGFSTINVRSSYRLQNYHLRNVLTPPLGFTDVFSQPLVLNPPQSRILLHSFMSSSTVHLRAAPVSSLQLICFTSLPPESESSNFSYSLV